MRIIGYIGIVIAVITSLSSCDNQVKQERLEQIDSLGSFLNHVHEVVASVDSQLIVNRLTQIQKTGDWILENVTDTLDPKPGILLGDHLRCQKFYKKSLERYVQVKRELGYSEKQLATLRTDVKNSFYSDEEFAGYFRTEAESVARLVKATDELEGTYGVVNATFETTKPIVTSIVDSIKSIIRSPEAI